MFVIKDAAHDSDCSIDLDYIDPRSEERKDADNLLREEEKTVKAQRQKQWEDEIEAAKAAGLQEPEKHEDSVGSVRPDWGQSPIEVSLDFLTGYCER